MADMMWLKIVSSFLSAINTQFPQPAAEPPPIPTAKTQIQAAGQAETITADELLTRLEKSDEKISSIQADMVYDKIMVIAGDQQTRIGRLFFKAITDAASKEKSRTFAIHFDALKVGDRYDDTKKQQYIFDGEWLTERQVDAKQIIRRQVVKPGEKFDPLKIGEGPLPIPIGQKKADILARYDVTLVDTTDGLAEDELKTFVEHSWQLKLVPKPGADENFKEIRLWYREAPDIEGKPVLPRMARTMNADGDITTVRLIEMKINETIDPLRFDTAAPDATWSVELRPFRR